MTPIAELLAGEFRTYVPDLPGFGRSLPPSHPLTIPELADSAADLFDTLGIERATVLGNSLGCAILGAFAQRRPDRIERASMVSPVSGIRNRPLLRAIGQLALDARGSRCPWQGSSYSSRSRGRHQSDRRLSRREVTSAPSS